MTTTKRRLSRLHAEAYVGEVEVEIDPEDVVQWIKENPEVLGMLEGSHDPDILGRLLADRHNAEHAMGFRNCSDLICAEWHRGRDDYGGC